MGTLSVDKLVKTSSGAAEFTLPATDGAAGTVLQTDGSGNLSVAALAADTVTATQIAANAVTSSGIAANAVTSTQIADDAVTVAKLAATGTASSSTFLRGDNSWAAAGGSNAPAFHIVKTANQTIADDTWVKVTWDSTIIDTNSGMSLADEKWTVPSGEGGKYFVYASTYLYSNASHALQEIQNEIRINNTAKVHSNWRSVSNPSAQFSLYTAGILNLAAADYIDIWVHSNVSSSDSMCSGSASAKHTFFGAFKLDGIA